MPTNTETKIAETDSTFESWFENSQWAGAGKDAGELAEAAWKAALQRPKHTLAVGLLAVLLIQVLRDDSRKFYLMGDMPESFEKLTAAAAALWDKPQHKIKEDFLPLQHEWERYIALLEEETKLVDHGREKGIKVDRE